MIEIKNLNKYFNKGHKNQIHVINNVNLTLKDNGLVALLGPSGSGKTTLLNTIGGLDKVKSGSIYVNGEKITSRITSKKDRIRNLNIGYIFQDYKLIENMSVYDNVALVLKMMGIKDKKEIDIRVSYVLEKVGMYRYRNRPSNMLSGGERQRVGIARAIVKDPNIIIADEPTGNLDSKNSLEIMNIIKSISKDRLVILVTHENNLAKFYATRIVEIEDGKIIKDYENKHNDELDYEIDNRFYLKDFKNYESIKEKSIDVDVYSDGNDKIKLDIVLKNGNIYIKSNTKEKIEIIDDNSSIEFVNDHYKKIDQDTVNKYEFKFDEIINKNIKKKYSSILNLFTLIINGFKKVFSFPILKKILLIGFFLSGIFIMYSLSSISASLKIDDSDFVKVNPNYLAINNNIKVKDYLEYEKMDNVSYMMPGDSLVNFTVKVDDYYQTSTVTWIRLRGSLSDISSINEDNLIMGRMPKDKYEIVIDKKVLDNTIAGDYTVKMLGINSLEDMLNRKLTINNMPTFTIVGIVDINSPSIYTDSSLFINIIANSSDEVGYYGGTVISNNELLDYKLLENKINITKGRMPVNDYEVIVDYTNEWDMPLDKTIDKSVNGNKLKVVGYYKTKSNEYISQYLVNNNTIKYNLITIASIYTINSKDKEETLSTLQDMHINISDTYTKSRNDYINSRYDGIINNLIVSGIILVISLIEILLMIRSSFLSRIKEIGILRAIGVKRLDIYKMFMGEIIAITTIASVPGILFMAYIINALKGIPYIDSFIIINPLILIIAILLVFTFNLLVGLIPVFNTVKKTPAQILSRHDLD